MGSLLHISTNSGFTMLHLAAQEGHAEVVQLAIDVYKLDPSACTKVCVVGHAGVLQWTVYIQWWVVQCEVHVTDVYEHRQSCDRLIE